MLKRRVGVFCLLFALLVAGITTVLWAEGTGGATAVVIRGDLPKAGRLAVEDLEKLEPVTVKWKHHDREFEFTGVSLEKVVSAFGLVSGPKDDTVAKSEKRSGYKSVIVASAPDGYQAVYTFAEIAGTNSSPTKAFLVWKLDGKPLPEDMGPFRLVCTTDGEGARSVYHLAAIDVLDIRKLIPQGSAK